MRESNFRVVSRGTRFALAVPMDKQDSFGSSVRGSFGNGEEDAPDRHSTRFDLGLPSLEGTTCKKRRVGGLRKRHLVMLCIVLCLLYGLTFGFTLRTAPQLPPNENSYIPMNKQEYNERSAMFPRLPSAPRDMSKLVEKWDRLMSEFNIGRSALVTESCMKEDGTSHRYDVLRQRRGRVYFALNLHDSSFVLPTLGAALLQIAGHLGPESVFVSVYESGSTDNTRPVLDYLADVFNESRISYTIITDHYVVDWDNVNRIDQLAQFRNMALQPLYRSGPWSDVVFINDVYVCATDILELLYQRATQGAHATCGFDWRPSKTDIKFYDNWVTRSRKGNTLRPRVDLFAERVRGVDELFSHSGDAQYKPMLRSGAAIPAYSCWNGVVTLDPAPFMQDKITFHAGNQSAGECLASECKMLARDFWAHHYDRWVLVPHVHVTYDAPTFTHPLLRELRGNRHHTIASKPIDWSLAGVPESVMCYSYKGSGSHLDALVMPRRDPPF